MTRLKITFLDNKDQEHYINFKISNSDLAKRWKSIIIENQQSNTLSQSNKFIHSVFSNNSYTQLPKINIELRRTVKVINEIYDQKLPEYSANILNRSQLNLLHEQFEAYGDRVSELRNSGVLNSELHTNKLHVNFCRLNELIHNYEDAIANIPGSFPKMGVLIDYWPPGVYSPLLERDKVYFDTNFKWGDLYLGYNTLGKDWINVWIDNDIDVIARDQVRPQQRFSAENWVYFGRDMDKFERVIEFEKWYFNLPSVLQDKVPTNNLNDLSIGRLYIGSIIIDEYFLKYENDPKLWQLPNSKVKIKWNHEVFSTFKNITKFDFYE
jgi:hypothetical protein